MVAPLTPETGNKVASFRGRGSTDRVRTGVTGLAFIVLLVALATAVVSGVRRTANVSDSAVPVTADAPGTNKTGRTDPLGPLGVTPPVEQPVPANGAATR